MHCVKNSTYNFLPAHLNDNGNDETPLWNDHRWQHLSCQYIIRVFFFLILNFILLCNLVPFFFSSSAAYSLVRSFFARHKIPEEIKTPHFVTKDGKMNQIILCWKLACVYHFPVQKFLNAYSKIVFCAQNSKLFGWCVRVRA